MIFDKSMLLAASGRGGDESDVVRFTCTMTVSLEDAASEQFVLSSEREDSSDDSYWVDNISLDCDGLFAIRLYAPFPIGTSCYDIDSSAIELSINGYSLKPFNDVYDGAYASQGDLYGSHYQYELAADLDDPIVVPALLNLTDGEERKISFKLKGLKAAIAS